MTSRPTTDWPLVRKRFIINPTECQVPHHQLGLKTTEYRCLFRSPLWFQVLRVVSRWWRLTGQSVVRCLLFFLSHIHHECRAHCLCSSYTPRLHITSCFRLPPPWLMSSLCVSSSSILPPLLFELSCFCFVDRRRAGGRSLVQPTPGLRNDHELVTWQALRSASAGSRSPTHKTVANPHFRCEKVPAGAWLVTSRRHSVFLEAVASKVGNVGGVWTVQNDVCVCRFSIATPQTLVSHRSFFTINCTSQEYENKWTWNTYVLWLLKTVWFWKFQVRSFIFFFKPLI